MAVVTVKQEKGVWVALKISNRNLLYLKQAGSGGKLIVERDGIRKMVSVKDVELYGERTVDMTESRNLMKFKE